MTDQPAPDAHQPDDLELLLADAPTWPKVVGIISIVWGSISLACFGISVGGMVLLRPMMQSAAEEAGGNLPPSMQMGATQYVAMGAGALLAALLLTAGITTAARRRIGRILHLVYAALAIIMAFWGTAVQIKAQQEMADWVAANPDSPFAQGYNPLINYIVMGVMLVLGLAWPLFCLLWFTLSKRGTSDMQGTGLEPAA